MINPGLVEQVKRLAIVGLFSDDTLLDRLVLKGGNLLDIVYGISTRASVDVDLSMDGEFAESNEELRQRIERALTSSFSDEGLRVFDVNLRAVPPNLSGEMTDFWGGYKIDFKVIESAKYEQFRGNIDDLRRNSLSVGKRGSTKFAIDISKYEYCNAKEMLELEGYTIFVYPPAMVVCEKLRAICQQMPEYVAMVKSHPSARARDFVDIHVVAEHCPVTFSDEVFHDMMRKTFEIKRVPLKLLGEIQNYRDFHSQDFVSVRDTVKPGVELREFDFYFDYVIDKCQELKSLWHE